MVDVGDERDLHMFGTILYGVSIYQQQHET